MFISSFASNQGRGCLSLLRLDAGLFHDLTWDVMSDDQKERVYLWQVYKEQKPRNCLHFGINDGWCPRPSLIFTNIKFSLAASWQIPTSLQEKVSPAKKKPHFVLTGCLAPGWSVNIDRREKTEEMGFISWQREIIYLNRNPSVRLQRTFSGYEMQHVLQKERKLELF